jgi:hypothetical protein
MVARSSLGTTELSEGTRTVRRKVAPPIERQFLRCAVSATDRAALRVNGVRYIARGIASGRFIEGSTARTNSALSVLDTFNFAAICICVTSCVPNIRVCYFLGGINKLPTQRRFRRHCCSDLAHFLACDLAVVERNPSLAVLEAGSIFGVDSVLATRLVDPWSLHGAKLPPQWRGAFACSSRTAGRRARFIPRKLFSSLRHTAPCRLSSCFQSLSRSSGTRCPPS